MLGPIEVIAMELAKDCECCATLVVFITSEFVEGGQCCATFIPRYFHWIGTGTQVLCNPQTRSLPLSTQGVANASQHLIRVIFTGCAQEHTKSLLLITFERCATLHPSNYHHYRLARARMLRRHPSFRVRYNFVHKIANAAQA